MLNQRNTFGTTSRQWRRLVRAAAVAFLALSIPVAGFSQGTTGSVRGTVVDSAGTPVSGANVVITDTRTSTRRSTTAGADGAFSLSGLAIGGPFEINVNADSYKVAQVTDVYTSLSETAEFNIVMESGALEEIVVTASRDFRVGAVALGPSATFSLEELQAAPAINRNITDVIRADSRIYVDESRGDINAVQCAGKNSRFNSLTVDGVRMNDSFGLNSNGYPTERMPFSFDAINQVAVELAPFDATYGGFSACTINAVTKSGSNEFFGSAFFDYTDDSLRGDKLEGDKIETGSFDEQRYGFTLGGPIVRDKLFFFAAYEKLDGANLFDRGPIGSGAVNEVLVTQAELDEIVEIANEVYLYDPGPIPTSLDHEDEKILIKLDWNINDLHRMAFTYQFNDGENFTESDSESNEFEFENHLYERGAELNSYVGSLYSDWTDRFSTELRVSYLEIDNRQIPVAGTDFGEIRVELADVDVYLGADDSRHANKLDYDLGGFRLKGTYEFDNHAITAGIEYEELEIFNMFVQHVETEIRYDGIQNFRDGFADAIYYNNAPSNIAEDAAAEWGYEVTTLFAQDQFEIGDRWTIVAGLRYEYYTTDDAPPENSDFTADYGFPNTATLDGEGLFQPRIGFTFDWTGNTTLRGGVGLYSGGNPNVWLSNNYSANNVQQFGQRGRSFCYTPDFRGDCGPEGEEVQRSLFDDDVVYEAVEPDAPAGAGAGWGVPSELYDAVAAGVGDNFEINYLDPDFDLPSEWKFALGVTHAFPRDYILTADLLYTRGQDMAMVLHGDIDQVGTDPDGYPIYEQTREASFVLTNSNENPEAYSLSLGLSKSFDNGFDFTVGYTYSDAEDVNPMTSSVAFSNYQNRAFFDPQEDVSSLSNYNIEHRFTFTTTWRTTFFDRFPSVFSLFGQSNTGRPYSVAFNGTADPYGFTPFLDFRTNVLEPGVSRNSETGSSWTKLDFRFDIGIPLVGDEDRLAFFMIIDNLTNLLNDDWGVLSQHAFPRTVPEGTPEPRIGDASRYEIRFGLRYDF
jgi:outer membrane receptor for ferrienterochelin and colicin